MANYLGQGYTITVAVVITPFYLQYLGAEAYGLVGFYVLMQNWLSLLDMGFSASLGRQVAYARGQTGGFDQFHHLLKSFELIFLVLTVCMVLGIYFGSGWIARSWVKPNTLSYKDVAYCVAVMGLIVGLRFFSTIYRSGINGFEDQIWINKATIAFSTLRYFGYFLVLLYVSKNIRLFFEYQLLLGVVEVFCLWKRFYYRLPSLNGAVTWLSIDWSVFKKVLPFMAGISYTSSILIASTQFDKLLLSSLLTLEEFGYFSLIVLISGSLLNLATPVFLAFLPRLTILASRGAHQDMVAMYSNLTQIIAWITLSSGLIIAMYSQEIFYALIGDKEAIHLWHKVLSWYVLGACVGVLGTLQYYLQNALGRLRLYVIGSTIFILVQAPLIYWVTTRVGALGVGKLWLALNTIWFFGWTSVVHSRLIPGFHIKWLAKDFIPMLAFIVVLSFLVKSALPIDIGGSRVMVAARLSIVALLFLVATSVSVKSIRLKMIERARVLF